MKVLLDTQALLWFLLDDSRLSENARESIVSTGAPIFVSTASIWEIAIKISLEKYSLPEFFISFWERQMQINDFTFLPVSVAQIARIIDLPFHHRDPFDRLIIAQALVEGLLQSGCVVGSFACRDERRRAAPGSTPAGTAGRPIAVATGRPAAATASGSGWSRFQVISCCCFGYCR